MSRPGDLPGAVSVVDLPGRGRLRVRVVEGPPGAPVLVLLHGVGVDADAQWGRSLSRLAGSFRVIAPDLRGHGAGIRAPFGVAAAAGDVAALLPALGVTRAVVGAYSMGGPVALELQRRAPALVGGLVLAATAASFPLPAWQRRVAAVIARHNPLARDLQDRADAGPLLDDLAVPRPVSRRISVPSAVVMTAADPVVAAAWQERLAADLPGAIVVRSPRVRGHLAFRDAAFTELFAGAAETVAGLRSGVPAAPDRLRRRPLDRAADRAVALVWRLRGVAPATSAHHL